MNLIGLSRGPGRRLIPNKVMHNSDGTTEIILERKTGPLFVCTIDTLFYDLIKGHRWSAYRASGSKTYYAKTCVLKPDGKQTTLYIQQFILPDTDEIDHKDGNGLNNRKENLRPATHSQNMANRKKISKNTTSKFLGVHWREDVKKFRAYLSLNKKRFDLGHFHDEVEAAKAHDKAALAHFGEFARLNFPNLSEGERAA
jgi:hypothetical protein